MRPSPAAVLLVTLLASPAPCAGEAPTEPRPAVQIIRFRPGDTPAAAFASLAAAGVGEAIVRVFSNTGDRPLYDGAPAAPGVLFRTASLRVSADLWPDIRAAAAAAGIRAWPWVATRSLPPSTAGTSVESSFHPDRGVVPAARLSLFDEEFLARLGGALGDLAAAGSTRIFLQDDWLHRWGEPLSPAASDAFSRDTGLDAGADVLFPGGTEPAWRAFFDDPAGMPALGPWLAWKARTAASTLASLAASVARRNPEAVLVPSIPYEVPAEPDRGLAWYGLSLADLRKNGIPEVAVMAYHRQMEREMGISGEALRGYLRSMAAGLAAAGYGGEASLIKLQGVDWADGSPVPAAELDETAAPFREAGFTRFAIVLSGIPFPAGFPAKASP